MYKELQQCVPLAADPTDFVAGCNFANGVGAISVFNRKTGMYVFNKTYNVEKEYESVCDEMERLSIMQFKEE